MIAHCTVDTKAVLSWWRESSDGLKLSLEKGIVVGQGTSGRGTPGRRNSLSMPRKVQR